MNSKRLFFVTTSDYSTKEIMQYSVIANSYNSAEKIVLEEMDEEYPFYITGIKTSKNILLIEN